MIWLPCDEEIITIRSAVSMEYRRVTDGQTDGQTDRRTDNVGQNCYINIVCEYADAR